MQFRMQAGKTPESRISEEKSAFPALNLIGNGVRHTALAENWNSSYEAESAEARHVYPEMSGYDILLPNQGVLVSRRAKKTFELLRSLNRRKKHYSFPLFNSVRIAQNIIEESEKLFPHRFGTVSLDGRFDEFSAKGSEQDFAFVFSYIVTFCGCKGKRNSLDVKLSGKENRIAFTVTANTSFSAYELAELSALWEHSDSAEAQKTANRFCRRFHAAKLVAESNVWDFRVEPKSDGTVMFLLELPAEQVNSEFILRDAEKQEIRKLLEKLLRDAEENEQP